MDLWFRETIKNSYSTSFKVRETLHREKTPFQEILLLETEDFGRMMVLDQCIMLTERDEFLYHEMLVHPVLCAHPNPKKVLVIGGGDGGTVREILRYPQIESVDLVEIDEAVVRVSQKYLPALSACLDESRVKVYFEDGVKFIQTHPDTYDVILVDSTDPVGIAEGLISESFYDACKKALRGSGILAMQSGSPFLYTKEIPTLFGNLYKTFPTVHMYLGPMLSYPSGQWSYAFASKTALHPVADFQEERAQKLKPQLKYYNPDMHRAAFCLPNFVQDMLPRR